MIAVVLCDVGARGVLVLRSKGARKSREADGQSPRQGREVDRKHRCNADNEEESES